MAANKILYAAPKPPMGWNSYDCFGSAVCEHEVRANADYMATHLLKHGWQYIVVDFCWSHPDPGPVNNPHQEFGDDGTFKPALEMDEYGRLLPATARFPSSHGAVGFTALADYVHSRGLKFGIHIMRGIPRQAVLLNVPIFGTKAHAADVAILESKCSWLNHMYGVNVSKPAGQAYYDSLFELYAQWGVDYVKVDDISYFYDYPELDPTKGRYGKDEIEAIRRAIDKCGREMILSLSPGPAPIEQHEHLKEHVDMWRISADFWDEWRCLKAQFDLCHAWTEGRVNGHWPDADMLPFGRLAKRGPIGEPRWSRFTMDEHYTLMTLWCIFRSPLMFGGDMPENDDFTLSLLTNDEAIAVNQHSRNGRQLHHNDRHVVWIADIPDSCDKYVAAFNISDETEPSQIPVVFAEIGLSSRCGVRDIWKKENIGIYDRMYSPLLEPHGVSFVRVSPT